MFDRLKRDERKLDLVAPSQNGDGATKRLRCGDICAILRLVRLDADAIVCDTNFISHSFFLFSGMTSFPQKMDDV